MHPSLAHILGFAVVFATGLPIGLFAGCGGSSAQQPESPTRAEPDIDPDRPGYRRAATPDLEDGDDDSMQLEGTRGRLDTYDIQEGMRPHVGDLERCYTAKLGQRRYVGGDVEFAFVVSRDGTVKQVQILQSDLGAWPMEKCMLEVCRQMTFVKPTGGRDAEFSIPLSFTARAAVDQWDEERTSTAIAEVRAQLDTCAAETGAPAPSDVRVTFYVASRGQIPSVGFSTATSPLDETWANCAEAKILAWTVSPTQGRVARASFIYTPPPEPPEPANPANPAPSATP